MMKRIKKEVRQNSSIQQKIRAAAFVPYKTRIVESFKNSGNLTIWKKLKPKFNNLWRFFNSMLGKPKLWASFIEWKELRGIVALWFTEAFIEGVIANWWTHKIFGLDFSIGMIIAHGFLIKQGLGIHQRIKQNGPTTTILKANN